jgi:uncharacterized protein (DUF58 family)
MNPVTILTDAINNLWYWTYGIVAGWGLTFTIVVSAIILLTVRHLKLQRKLTSVENRLVALERDFNQQTKTWPGKK